MRVASGPGKFWQTGTAMKQLSRKFSLTRRPRSEDLPGVVATARMDHKTKALSTRLKPGDIAIIDHADLDRTGADALITCQVAGVVNVARSITGRYPNLGPELLVEAGIPLIDDVGPDVFERVSEGDRVRLDGDTLYQGDHIVAKGRRQDLESVASAMAEAKTGLAAEIEAFVANTMEYIKHEYPLLIDGIGAPALRTKFEGRDALVVVRGYRYREDLAQLRSYIRECKPVLVGVDGGADALVEAGYLPNLIVGDMDSVSDRALSCGAEIVVHAYPDGRAPGLARVQSLGLDSVTCPATGTSEDIALLLADEKGASLIVTVGRHDTLVEFLDKGRSGMSSTFLTRLRVIDKLVDQKGVSRLYRSRVSPKSVIPLVLAAAVTVVAALIFLPAGQIFLRYLGTELDTLRYWLTGLF
jgi:uncharacterized membrane-anchored protein